MGCTTSTEAHSTIKHDRRIGKSSAKAAATAGQKSATSTACFYYKYSLRCATQELVSASGTAAIREELAVRRKDGKIFKVRIIPKIGNFSQMELENIRRIGWLLEQLQRDHVIAMEEYFNEDQCFVCVFHYDYDHLLFEYLHELLSNEDFQFNELFIRDVIMKKLFESVRHCHEQNIVHRDIKPAHIMISTPSESNNTNKQQQQLVRLTGFHFADKVSNDHQLQDFVGTPAFMAPEVLKSHIHSKPADMWSLGVVMFLLLCGATPFQEGTEQQKSSLKKILHGNYKMNDVYWSNISLHGKDLVQRLLQINPKSRLTIDEVLLHPWFSIPSKELMKNDLKPILIRLGKYYQKQLLQDAITNLNSPQRIKAHLQTCKLYVDMIINQENSKSRKLKRNGSFTSNASTLTSISTLSKNRFHVQHQHKDQLQHDEDSMTMTSTAGGGGGAAAGERLELEILRVPTEVDEVVIGYKYDSPTNRKKKNFQYGIDVSSHSSPPISITENSAGSLHKRSPVDNVHEVLKTRNVGGKGNEQLKQFAALRKNQQRINETDRVTKRYSKRHPVQEIPIEKNHHHHKKHKHKMNNEVLNGRPLPPTPAQDSTAAAAAAQGGERIHNLGYARQSVDTMYTDYTESYTMPEMVQFARPKTPAGLHRKGSDISPMYFQFFHQCSSPRSPGAASQRSFF